MDQNDPINQLRPLNPPTANPVDQANDLLEPELFVQNGNLNPLQNQALQNEIDNDNLEEIFPENIENLPLIIPPPIIFPRNYLIIFCEIVCMFFFILLTIIFPIFTLSYVSYQQLNNDRYYSPQQISIIVITAIKLLVWSFFTSRRTIKTSLRYFVQYTMISVHFIVWDFAHKGGFLTVPSLQTDFVYKCNYIIFYAMLLMYLTVIGFIALVVLIGIILFCFEKFRKRRIALENRNYLQKLRKQKRKDWVSEHRKMDVEGHVLENTESCCICYGNINEESFITEIPVCKHVFHYDCVMEWLEQNAVCPYCRSDVVRNIKAENLGNK